MLDEVKQLRERAEDLIKKANKLENEYFESKSNTVLGKYFKEKDDCYYKVISLTEDSEFLNCFSLFIDNEKTICTEFETASFNRLNNMVEVTKDEVAMVFDKVFEFQRKHLIG